MNEIELYYQNKDVTFSSGNDTGKWIFRKLIRLNDRKEQDCISVFRFSNYHNPEKNLHYNVRNNFCTLFLFMHGHSNLIINGETFYSTNGSVVVKNDKDIHRPYSYVQGINDYYGINFPSEYVKNLKGNHFLYDLFYGSENKRFQINSQKTLEDIIDAFENINRKQNENDLLLYAYVIELVHLIYDAINKPSTRSARSLIADATDYITSNFKTINSIDDIARHCNVSTSYLCRIFKKKLKCTVNDIVTNLRLENSIELLRRGYSVMDSAASSGFKNYQYYVTLFKKKFGATPLKFISEINKEQLRLR